MIRAASFSFPSACLSPTESRDASTFNSAGAKRAIIRFSSARSGMVAAARFIARRKGASLRMPPIYRLLSPDSLLFSRNDPHTVKRPPHEEQRNQQEHHRETGAHSVALFVRQRHGEFHRQQ